MKAHPVLVFALGFAGGMWLGPKLRAKMMGAKKA